MIVGKGHNCKWLISDLQNDWSAYDDEDADDAWFDQHKIWTPDHKLSPYGWHLITIESVITFCL